MTTATSTATHLTPIQCAPWCENGTGHADAGHPDDQWCCSISLPVDLSLEELAVYGDGTMRPVQIRVYANRDHGELANVAFVNQDDRSTTFTPREARETAKALMHAAWLAEQGI